MIGTGLFINTVEVAKRMGPFGFVSYGIVALLMLPLVLAMSRLLKRIPEGNFFTFGRQGLSSFWGFFNTWNYFFAKLGSATLGIHIFVSTIQQLFPLLQAFNVYLLDCFILIFFLLLNLFHAKIASFLQKYLVISKLIPIVAVIFLGLLSNRTFAGFFHSAVEVDLISTIPIVLFSFLGFEAICALSNRIENAERNSAYAVLFSYGIVALMYMTYQFLFYRLVGERFFQMNDFKQALPALFFSSFSVEAASFLGACLCICIGFSVLSSAYGILSANQWNLFTAAEHKVMWGHRFIVTLNSARVPVVCLLTEVLICALYLYVSHGKQFILQQLAALGSTVTYAICALSLFHISPHLFDRILGVAALVSCTVLSAACVNGFLKNGIAVLYLYCSILCIGCLFFFIEKLQQKNEA